MDWRNGNDWKNGHGKAFAPLQGGGAVVSLMDSLDGPLPTRLAEMEAYWLALRGDGTDVPARADFNPRGVAGLLDSTMLLERIAPGIVRIRLAGMALADLLGMELRGMPLSALFLPEARDGLAAHLEQVFEGPRILRMRLEGERGILKPALAAEFLALPMRGQDGAINRALGCLITEGKAGRSPRRLSIRQVATRPVPGYAPSSPKTAPAVPREPAMEGMAEAPATFSPAPNKRPILRVIQGGID